MTKRSNQTPKTLAEKLAEKHNAKLALQQAENQTTPAPVVEEAPAPVAEKTTEEAPAPVAEKAKPEGKKVRQLAVGKHGPAEVVSIVNALYKRSRAADARARRIGRLTSAVKTFAKANNLELTMTDAEIDLAINLCQVEKGAIKNIAHKMGWKLPEASKEEKAA